MSKNCLISKKKKNYREKQNKWHSVWNNEKFSTQILNSIKKTQQETKWNEIDE